MDHNTGIEYYINLYKKGELLFCVSHEKNKHHPQDIGVLLVRAFAKARNAACYRFLGGLRRSIYYQHKKHPGVVYLTRKQYDAIKRIADE